VKGVVLAGGSGTRLDPLTRVTNKHLLPVYNQPMIFYPLQSLVQAGIKDIMVVTGGNNAGDFLRLLGNGRDFGLSYLRYAYQDRPGGIGEALSLADKFVDGDRCVVILGDNIVEKDLAVFVAKFADQKAGARLLLKQIDNPSRLSQLGVAYLENGQVVDIEEKPLLPKSSFAVTGVYMYDATVFDLIRGLKPSGRGEVEVSDLNNAYVARGQLEADMLTGFWGDAGESIDDYWKVFQYVAKHWQTRSKRKNW